MTQLQPEPIIQCVSDSRQSEAARAQIERQLVLLHTLLPQVHRQYYIPYYSSFRTEVLIMSTNDHSSNSQQPSMVGGHLKVRPFLCVQSPSNTLFSTSKVPPLQPSAMNLVNKPRKTQWQRCGKQTSSPKGRLRRAIFSDPWRRRRET